MIKKFMCLFVACAFLFLGTACTTKQPSNEPPIQEEPGDSKQEFEVTLYYANGEYIKTGDESLEKMIPVKKTIQTTEDQLPLALLEELKKPSDVENATSEILSNLVFLGIDVKDSVAYVDLSSENLNGGSLEEFFIMNQIVYTLTELQGIDKVQFLVDGNKVESLMGHFSTEEPLGREDIK